MNFQNYYELLAPDEQSKTTAAMPPRHQPRALWYDLRAAPRSLLDRTDLAIVSDEPHPFPKSTFYIVAVLTMARISHKYY